MTVDSLLETIPPLLVYLTVGIVIGLESLGIPLPGEIVLVSAALLSSRHELDVSPLWIAVAGSAGAIIGDSIGYAIGHRFGPALRETKLVKKYGAEGWDKATDILRLSLIHI